LTGTELPDLSISELAPLIERRQVSPVEVTAAVLERIERLDPILHSYITVLPERAMDEARQAEREILAGRHRGPLHGIPIAHKDVVATKGVRTTAHSRVLLDHVPDDDATVVRRLAEAGTILLGKLNTYEFACGATEVFGVPVNPWDTGRITAGSSAGSGSALAAGLAFGATGTDTGGSIRSPASFCGVVGLKPTYGLVSRAGVLPLSWSLDHVGPMGRRVRDVGLLLAAIAGHDAADPGSAMPSVAGTVGGSARGGDPSTAGLRGVRIGVPRDLFGAAIDAAVRSAFDEALEVLRDLGASVTAIDLPEASLTAAAQKGVMLPEATLVHAGWLRSRPYDYSASTRRRLLLGAAISGPEYLEAQRLRQLVRHGLAVALERVDVLVWPTSARPALTVDETQVPVGLQTRLTNLTGTPSLSLPCGFSPDGLPLALQVNGRPFDEATVIRVAAAFEATTGFHKRLPAVAAEAPKVKGEQRLFETPVGTMPSRDREVLVRDLENGLRRLEIPLLPEDREPLISDLYQFREVLRLAVEASSGRLEPSVHQAPLASPTLEVGAGGAGPGPR
jgi:aspartyl-tRNA(Asn)/glutamyl-tRNA(Gln) amidotransferase subunit A